MSQQKPPTERTYDQPASEDENDDEENDYAGDEEQKEETPMFVAASDFNGVEPGDLSFKKGDLFRVVATRQDGWWMVENAKRQQGLVPSNYLKVHSRYEQIPSPTPRRHQAMLHRESGYPPQQIWQEKDISDVLKSSGALPIGCEPSILYKLMRATDPRLSIEFHLLPKLSQTGIGFHDLYWNIDKDKLRKRHVRFLKLFKVLRCENMPTETIDLDVVHRYVRFCLFDGVKVLSNIHTIKAQYNKNKPKTWNFLGRTTKEYGEISAGWSTVPLLSESGQMRLEDDKLYAVSLKGGTPFDREIQLHPTAVEAKSQSGNFLQNILAAERVAKVVVRVTAPNVEMLEQLDSGPDTLVWNTLFLPFVYWYRHLAGEVILRQRVKEQEGSAVLASITTLVADPFLASFPKAASSSEIIDTLRSLWDDRWKLMTKTDKKSIETCALKFREFFLETGFPLLQLPGLYSAHFNPVISEKRKQECKEFVQQFRTDKNAVSWLATKESAPLDLMQMMVDLSTVYAE